MGTQIHVRVRAHSLPLLPALVGEAINTFDWLQLAVLRDFCVCLNINTWYVLFCPSGLFACLGVRVLSTWGKGWGRGSLRMWTGWVVCFCFLFAFPTGPFGRGPGLVPQLARAKTLIELACSSWLHDLRHKSALDIRDTVLTFPPPHCLTFP